MGNCLTKGAGHVDPGSSTDDKMNTKTTFPTLDGQGSSFEPKKSNTLSKYSITQPPSNPIPGLNKDESKDNHLSTSARRNSFFDSETKQILGDDVVFSREAIRVAHTFWSDNVAILSNDRRQEIGVSLYAQMFRKMPECRKIFLRGDIQATASKFLGMIGWLIMELSSHNQDVWAKVKRLGKVHRSYEISYEHYLPMLKAFHITFEDQFKKAYTLRVKFCIENLFMNAAKLMTEKDFITLFAERVQDLETLEFLDSLDACLAHQTGREYFERYLEQTFCAEYVVFLKGFDEYKQIGNIQQRFEKAHEIFEKNFRYDAQAPIDLKKDQEIHVKDLKKELDKYQTSLLSLTSNLNDDNDRIYQLPDTLLDVLYGDVKQLIEENAWSKFHDGIYSIKQACRVNDPSKI